MSTKQRTWFAALGFSLMFSTLLSGCGKDTVGNEVVRERDRDREKAATISADYDVVNGFYTGDTTDAKIGLLVETSRITQDGTTVPQPSLIGSVSFAPNILIGKTGQRVRIAFPFRDGVYDKVSGDLSFTIDKDDKPTPVKCHLGADKATLACTWYSRLFNKDFTVVRGKKEDALLMTQEKLETQKYVGSVFGNSVTASFEAALDQEEGSQLLQLTIVGQFDLSTKPGDTITPMSATADANAPSDLNPHPAVDVHFLFYNGTYDVATGTLSMKINADPEQILVNCQIESPTRLRCKWHGRDYAEFVLEKE